MGKRRFSKVLKYDLYRAVCAKRFWFAAAGICFFLLTGNEFVTEAWLAGEDSGFYDIVSIYFQTIHMDRFRCIVLLFAACIYTDSFCIDRQNDYTGMLIQRSGLENYVLSKVLANGIGVFLAYSLGTAAYLLLLGTQYPMQDVGYWEEIAEMSGWDLGIYTELPMSIRPAVMCLGLTGTIGLSMVMLTSLGMYLSLYIPDRFVAVGAPCILYFLLSTITMLLPEAFSFPSLSDGTYWLTEGLAVNLIEKCLVQIGCIFLTAWLIERKMERWWFCSEKR